MEEQRPMYVGRIILAFVIATIIFSGGFLTSYLITYYKYSEISISQEELRYSLLGIELEKQLITSSCNIFDFQSISGELDNIGGYVGILEDRFGKNDVRVSEQKKIYSMLEVQHFLLINDYNDKCVKDLSTILFFYSNEEDYMGDAEKVGYILSSLKIQDNEIMIYSFDYDLDSNLVKLLKKKYGIKVPNTVIINENKKIEGLTNIDQIRPYLDVDAIGVIRL